jgi:hypothetical protein
MEGSCSTGQSPQWAVVPVEEEEEEEEEEEVTIIYLKQTMFLAHTAFQLFYSHNPRHM